MNLRVVIVAVDGVDAEVPRETSSAVVHTRACQPRRSGRGQPEYLRAQAPLSWSTKATTFAFPSTQLTATSPDAMQKSLELGFSDPTRRARPTAEPPANLRTGATSTDGALSSPFLRCGRG